MMIPVLNPSVQPTRLPTDFMERIAKSVAQTRFAGPLLQSRVAQNQATANLLRARAALAPITGELQQAQAGAIPSEIAQRQAQQELTQQQIGALPSEIALRQAQAKKATAEAKKARVLPVTKIDEIKNAQDFARSQLQQFGPKDVRTLTAFSNLAKLTGLKGVPGEAPVTAQVQPPITPSPTNTPQANATINMANAQTAPTTEEQAATEINAAIPKSNLIKPAQQTAAQPDIQKQQDLNTESTNILRGLTAKTQDDPFAKAQATALNGEWKNVSASATTAVQTELPLYKSLFEDMQKTNLTNPATGGFLWTTPQGQVLQADLTRAQGEFIKSFHLGRMTQLEFNFLKNAIGTSKMYPSALRKLFTKVMTKDYVAKAKSEFYHNYISKGGRKIDEVDESWIKALPGVQKQSAQQANNDVLKIRIGKLPVTAQQVDTLAKNNNITTDRALEILRTAQEAGKL